MAGGTFKTKGFREFERNLMELALKDAKRVGRAAVRKPAKKILASYKAKTTVKSGNLVENEKVGTRLTRRQRALTPRPKPSEIEIHIGTADPAGIQEEFGGRQPANPSLTPAWDEHGGANALADIGKELDAGLQRAARRKKKG